MKNRKFKGWCSNSGNHNSHILHYDISTVRYVKIYGEDCILDEITTVEDFIKIDQHDGSGPFYIICATFKMNFSRGPIKIYETDDLEKAIFIAESISGNKVIEDVR
jgi:hypothetical protein